MSQNMTENLTAMELEGLRQIAQAFGTKDLIEQLSKLEHLKQVAGEITEHADEIKEAGVHIRAGLEAVAKSIDRYTEAYRQCHAL